MSENNTVMKTKTILASAPNLTQETFQVLMDFHEKVYRVEYGASIVNWPGKKVQLKKLQGNFV
ncbi:hypothetical protein N7526_001998 [Penicillium atrosanguineum]|nr:hypothetical protein N7526_001998 [Penicillium atrosanguineum]